MERRIEGRTRLQAPADRALRVLRDHVEVILGTVPLATRLRRELGVGPIRHEISLHVGSPEDTGNRVARRLSWEATLHPDVFPVSRASWPSNVTNSVLQSCR